MKFLTLALTLLALAACGGGGGGGGSSPITATTQTGQFIDDPVAGLTYTCSSESKTYSGTTGLQGEFTYESGQNCTFSVGKVTLGILKNIPSDGKVTPQDVAGVSRTATSAPSAVAIAQFLQTLNDGSTNGKIVIPIATTNTFNTNAVAPVTLASSNGSISQADLSNLVTTLLPNKTLVSAGAASANLSIQMTQNNISTTSGSVSASSPVVLNSIAVTSSNNNRPAGLTSQLTATGYYSDGSTKDITSSVSWSSSDTSILTLANTVVTGKKAGYASVIASLTPSGSSAAITGSTVITTAAPVVVSVAITNSNSLAAGLTDQLTATATLTDGSTANVTTLVTWVSSDTSKATIVSTTGLVTGLVKGTSTITARYGTETPIAATYVESVLDPTILNLVISYVQSGISSISFLGNLSLQAVLNLSDSTTKVVSSIVNWTISNRNGGGGTVTTDKSLNNATLTGTSSGNISINANYSGFTSNNLAMAVLQPPPTITSQPSATSGYEKSDATFTVTGTGIGTISYQWKKNGLNIIGANNSSYSLKNLSLPDDKSTFTVDLTNDGGTTTSTPAILTVLQLAPSIVKVGSFKFLSLDTYRFGINEFYLGDFNGDGLQDALIAGRLTQPATQSDWINSSVSIVLQTASGKFSIGTELLIQSGEEVIGGTEPAAVVHDFNRDGVDDFFIPGGTDSNYLVPSYFYLSQKGGKFIRKTLNTNKWFHGGVLADLDGDGYPEVVLSGYSSPQIYLKYENQNFTVKELAGTSTASGVAFGKFSDKGNELVFTDVGSKNESKQDGVIYSISSSNANGISLVESGLLPISRFYLTKWKDLINSGASHEYRAHSLDINNDGYDDLIVLSSPPPGSSKNVRELQILMGRKDGVFVDETDARLIGFDAFAGPDYGLKIVDINLDGCPDIFVDGNSFDGIGSKYFLVNDCKGVLSVKGLHEIRAFLYDLDGSVPSLTNPAMATPMTVVRGEGGRFYFLQLIYEQLNGARVASIYSGLLPQSFWK